MEHTKICKICGKEFTAKHGNEATCSIECKLENTRRIRRKYYDKQKANKPPKIKVPKIKEEKQPRVLICRCCNKPFIRTRANSKKIYCSKLCEKLTKLQQEKGTEKPKPKKTKKFKDNLSKDVYKCEQLNKERKERGERPLTYGYYKAYQKQGVI